MLPQRLRWVGRRRYELVGLAVALTLGVLHWATDGRQAGARSGPVAGVLRVLSALEGRASDLQMWGRGVRAPHPDVVVAAIDERSVQRYGRWPWSRELLARTVARLHEAFMHDPRLHDQSLEVSIVGERVVVRGELATPERCQAAGMDAFVAKPFTAGELISTIARLTGDGAAQPVTEMGHSPD